VIAIQNAQSVDEVRKLNSTLEQRISAATGELRRSNAQLQRLDKAKDEFISMASHQLRTPLTSIKGYLSMLIEGDIGAVSKEQKKVLSEAFVSSERMVRLIGDFLNVSRLQTGKFVIEKHPVDLARMVQREIDGLEQNALARDMKFVYKKPKDIPMLNIDENKVQQVVMNFCDNAIYYSKEKSKITVTLQKSGNSVVFKVIDTGIGVPKAEQARLFQKFFRAENARRARPDGTGVGLFLAKKVIDDHGGSIIFESKEGKGSTFGFRLPIA
jgi:signal transduction histidine kinase